MADKRINTTTRNEYIHETQNKNLTKSNVYKHDIYVVNENVFFFSNILHRLWLSQMEKEYKYGFCYYHHRGGRRL